MKNRLLLLGLGLSLAIPCFAEYLPHIAFLQSGEKIVVSMKSYGVLITGADFEFTPLKVIVTPNDKNPTELTLTQEEREKLDTYLSLIKSAETRPSGQEGFDYVVRYFRKNREIATFSYRIYDVGKSKEPSLAFYELKARAEKQDAKAEKAE